MLRKRNFLPLTTFANENFQIDPSVAMQMHQLQTIARWDVIVPKPHTFCDSHVLIYSLDTRSLPLHKNEVFLDYNLKTTHILCFNETHFNTLMFNKTSLNIDTRTHSMISLNGQNGTMIIYDNFTTLSSHETFTSLGLNILQQHSMQIQERLFIY
jgi:hypothetical protein